MNVKDWLVPMLRDYYHQKRRFADNAWPESYLGRAREERGGYGQGAMRVHYPEVRRGAGLSVRRAIDGMPYELRAVMDAHYAVAKVPVKEKATALGVSVAKYWSQLDCAYFWLAGRIERLDTQDAENMVNLVVDVG